MAAPAPVPGSGSGVSKEEAASVEEAQETTDWKQFPTIPTPVVERGTTQLTCL